MDTAMFVIGTVLAVFGLLLLLAFAVSRARCKTPTEAEIVGLDVKKHTFRGMTKKEYTPVFAYPVNGKKYTAKAFRSSSDPGKYTVGQRITVYTDPAHPERVRFGSETGFCIAGSVLVLLGIFIVVLVFL